MSVSHDHGARDSAFTRPVLQKSNENSKSRTIAASSDGRRRAFTHVAAAEDGAGHFAAIDREGTVYTWGRTSSLGRLGRGGRARIPAPALLVSNDRRDSAGSGGPEVGGSVATVRAIRAFAGGNDESGHTAVLDENGSLWLAGCDRWQQLGLGSSEGGASGYTWKALWQERFVKNDHLRDLMSRRCGAAIRDVALGSDHTVVLSSNMRDVYTFGKGGEGQLGLSGKPFVSAPAWSAGLSSTQRNSGGNIAAVCAIQHRSLTLGEDGKVLRKVGKCRMSADGMMDALKACQEQSKRDGLVKPSD
eukprot:CAMPEP_0183295924 /NCGR_PEP_ID=MMETSP0160_2-20130417/3691_1 /TAXON_ID=2839 ORGANISM="Odontella Sinensis, Strain Grunow 1884" /NCGR_SAMPLE_ID=MMETSP0160_2 /ASSEMBLY_ACC=CAM_ASM_000250 /LENGTH=302 /DNA_ID=CAMNT_0025457467 /DNA_START=20 /DNA_END=925 /DNA_ORIENTATION=+